MVIILFVDDLQDGDEESVWNKRLGRNVVLS